MAWGAFNRSHVLIFSQRKKQKLLIFGITDQPFMSGRYWFFFFFNNRTLSHYTNCTIIIPVIWACHTIQQNKISSSWLTTKCRFLFRLNYIVKLGLSNHYHILISHCSGEIFSTSILWLSAHYYWQCHPNHSCWVIQILIKVRLDSRLSLKIHAWKN